MIATCTIAKKNFFEYSIYPQVHISQMHCSLCVDVDSKCFLSTIFCKEENDFQIFSKTSINCWRQTFVSFLDLTSSLITTWLTRSDEEMLSSIK